VTQEHADAPTYEVTWPAGLDLFIFVEMLIERTSLHEQGHCISPFVPRIVVLRGLSTLREVDTNDCLSTAVWDLETILQFTSRVHEPPLVFPLLAWLIIGDLPWLIKRREPVHHVSVEVFRKIIPLIRTRNSQCRYR
jgi:hypothetical protein